MKDFFNTIIPLWEIAVKKAKGKLTHFHIFDGYLGNNESIHPITKRYQEKIKSVLNEKDDIQGAIDYIVTTFTHLIKRYNLIDEENQKLIFEQIVIFMNNLYLELRSKYIFNTLSNNDLEEFNWLSIWNKLNNLFQMEWNHSNAWCSCRHYALLFKHIFDIIEENFRLWISNYLYLEKTDWLNHAWLVVTFKWKNYLVDSSFFNGKLMQPIDNVWRYYDRMESLCNLYTENIHPKDTETLKDQYIEHNYNYYKVALKSADELLCLLQSIPQEEVWSFSKMYNILNVVFWVNFRISNTWILVSNTFTYHFNHNFKKEELDSISDDDLMDYIISSISYKTNKYDDRKITIFDFERKYIKDTLYFFSDKVDYSALRKILSDTD